MIFPFERMYFLLFQSMEFCEATTSSGSRFERLAYRKHIIQNEWTAVPKSRLERQPVKHRLIGSLFLPLRRRHPSQERHLRPHHPPHLNIISLIHSNTHSALTTRLRGVVPPPRRSVRRLAPSNCYVQHTCYFGV